MIRFLCNNNLTWIGRKLSANGFPSELSKFRNLEEIIMISMNNLIVASFLVLFCPRHYINGVICQKKKRHHTHSNLRVILVKLPFRDGGGPQEVCPKHSFIAGRSSQASLVCSYKSTEIQNIKMYPLSRKNPLSSISLIGRSQKTRIFHGQADRKG